MDLSNDNLKKRYSSNPEKQWVFEKIRAEYELQNGGWIFDLVHDKVFKAYGDILPLPLWMPWMDFLKSFLEDQSAFEYQIKEFGRDFAEKGYNELLKEEEESYSRMCAYWAKSNTNQVRKELIELFNLLTNKELYSEEYYTAFEIYYEDVRRKDIVHADLCLKFRLELKKRLFSDNMMSMDTPIQGVTQLTHPQISLFYIYTHRVINANNAEEIAKKYGQTSGDRLFREFQRLNAKLDERIAHKNSVKDLLTVIALLNDPKDLGRAKDELKAAKNFKGTD